jgi:ABC-type multidrug transport system fused ATPase/permease subunit
MQFTDDEAEKLAQKFQDSIAFAIARWKEQNPGQSEANAPWGKICRNAVLRCIFWDVAWVAIINCVADLL